MRQERCPQKRMAAKIRRAIAAGAHRLYAAGMSADPATTAWELVRAIHDRPLRGVANYQGVPHAFARNWNAANDDWADSFRLRRITGAHVLGEFRGDLVAIDECKVRRSSIEPTTRGTMDSGIDAGSPDR